MSFIAHATNDEEGMFVLGRKKGPDGLDTGVAGLHNLLRMGEVLADQDIHMGGTGYLVERHEKPP
jgi:hypothetical protein